MVGVVLAKFYHKTTCYFNSTVALNGVTFDYFFVREASFFK